MKLVVIGNGMGKPGQGECLEWHSTPACARPWMAAPVSTGQDGTAPRMASGTSNQEHPHVD